MIHYHGGPITPESCALRAWRGRHAFISFWEPRQIDLAAGICQSFALDNGAFSAWRNGEVIDWDDYYSWCADWLRHPACDWAVIPDVIGGSEAENDALIDEWPHDGNRGVPVWHLNESLDRLARLAAQWPRVALGSAQQYDVTVPAKALDRLAEAIHAIAYEDGMPTVKLHGLRMLNPVITTRIPLASGDSTNVAQNIGKDKNWSGPYEPSTKETKVDVLVERIESHPTPSTVRWTRPLHAASLFDDIWEVA